MGEFKGDSLAVYYNTVDISLQMQTVTVTEEGAEPPDIDITHKGDTTVQVLEGLPCAPQALLGGQDLLLARRFGQHRQV